MGKYVIVVVAVGVIGLAVLMFKLNGNAGGDILEQAAKDTYIPDIKILTSKDFTNDRKLMITYVEQSTKPGNGRYFCGGMDKQNAIRVNQDIMPALMKLPNEVWERIDMKYLLLCSEVRANKRSIGGIPVPPIKLLMLSVGDSHNPFKRLPFNTLHEFYHMAEMQTNNYNDKDWDSRFGGYNNQYTRRNSTIIGSGGLGFVNQYAKSFSHEERAEIFSILHMNPRGLSDHINLTNDDVLLEKVKFLRNKCNKFLGVGGC